MNTYQVVITETCEITTTVYAKTEDEAIQFIKQQYDNQEIILTADNFMSVEFNIME